MRLKEIAQIVRSKNAGPRTLTLDVIFATDADYQRVRDASVLTPEAMGSLYGVSPEQVRIFDYSLCRAIKITLPRRVTAGDPGDSDVYGAQQHGPLLEVEV